MNVAMVGPGWDARVTDGQGFDLDASVFAVGEDGKVLSDAHFIFFNNKTSPDGAVEHQATTVPVKATATMSRSKSI